MVKNMRGAACLFGERGQFFLGHHPLLFGGSQLLLHVGILREEVGVVTVFGRGQQGFDVGLLLF